MHLKCPSLCCQLSPWNFSSSKCDFTWNSSLNLKISLGGCFSCSWKFFKLYALKVEAFHLVHVLTIILPILTPIMYMWKLCYFMVYSLRISSLKWSQKFILFINTLHLILVLSGKNLISRTKKKPAKFDCINKVMIW